MARHSEHGSAKTNVTRLLETAGIPYKTFEYEVDEDDLSGMHIAEQAGVDPACMFKTLVMKGEKNGHFVCCLPVCDELDLKKVAKAFGDKKCDLIPMKTLRDLTGYIRGGCSPIGMKKKFPTFIDETAILFDEIYVNAGMRGMMVVVEPNALIEFVDAKTVDLVKD
ncbi:MAG: Cys-tRNA(Pro) deacylase [Thermoguttaceae bacterium]|nr:Cys-tRNA(Pro) deacylase [Thermoguttaceae bacterium]